jgi:hypothetical protein
LCEGEHDASVLAGLGINAVAVPHGAGTWRAAWGKALAGWSVAVLAHNDEAGLRHAERVRAELGPLVPEVRVGRPPDPFNDAAEMIEAGLRPEHVVTVERPAAAPALTKEEDRRGAEGVLSSSFVRPVESRGLRYGLIGEIVGVIEPDTEAGSVAVLVSLLAGASAMIGRGPHPMIANTRHPLTVWPLIFGRTTDGRKGESWSSARAVLDRADALFMADNVASGLSSGEGLIARLAENEDRPPVGDRARVVRGDGSYPPRRQCPATSTPRRLGWSPRHAHAAHRRRTRPAPTKGKKSRISPCEGPVLLKRTLRGGQRQCLPRVDPTKRSASIRCRRRTSQRPGSRTATHGRLAALQPTRIHSSGHRAELLVKGIAELVAARAGTVPSREPVGPCTLLFSCRFELASARTCSSGGLAAPVVEE